MSKIDAALVQGAHRNATLTIVSGALMAWSFTLPIWQLFYVRQLGLTLTQAMLLMAVFSAALAIANVMTGALADMHGRVRWYRYGLVVYVVMSAAPLVTHAFWVLAVVQCIAGIAYSMLDGSLEANVMDSYDQAELSKKAFNRFSSNQMTWIYLSRVASGVIGSWLYVIGAWLPLIGTVIVLALAIVPALFVREVRSGEVEASRNHRHIMAAMRYILNTRELRLFVVTTLIVCLACESLWAGMQPYLSYRHVPVEWFGVIFSAIALTSAATSYLYRHIDERFGWRAFSFFTIGTAVAGLGLAFFDAPLVPLVVGLLIGMGFGLIWPVAQSATRDNTPSQFRATVGSVRQLAYTGMFAIATTLVGIYVDRWGTGTMLMIIGAQAVVLLGLFCILILGNRTIIKEEI